MKTKITKTIAVVSAASILASSMAFAENTLETKNTVFVAEGEATLDYNYDVEESEAVYVNSMSSLTDKDATVTKKLVSDSELATLYSYSANNVNIHADITNTGIGDAVIVDNSPYLRMEYIGPQSPARAVGSDTIYNFDSDTIITGNIESKLGDGLGVYNAGVFETSATINGAISAKSVAISSFSMPLGKNSNAENDFSSTNVKVNGNVDGLFGISDTNFEMTSDFEITGDVTAGNAAVDTNLYGAEGNYTITGDVEAFGGLRANCEDSTLDYKLTGDLDAEFCVANIVCYNSDSTISINGDATSLYDGVYIIDETILKGLRVRAVDNADDAAEETEYKSTVVIDGTLTAAVPFILGYDEESEADIFDITVWKMVKTEMPEEEPEYPDEIEGKRIIMSNLPFKSGSNEVEPYVTATEVVDSTEDSYVVNSSYATDETTEAIEDSIKYIVRVEDSEGGSVTINEKTADANGYVTALADEEVTFTVTADEGYEVSSVTAGTDGTGAEIAVTDNGDGTYSITVPVSGGIDIEAAFEKIATEETTEDTTEEKTEDDSVVAVDSETEAVVDTTTKVDADAAPTTGDNMSLALIVMAFVSLSGAVVLTKKRAK